MIPDTTDSRTTTEIAMRQRDRQVGAGIERLAPGLAGGMAGTHSERVDRARAISVLAQSVGAIEPGARA